MKRSITYLPWLMIPLCLALPQALWAGKPSLHLFNSEETMSDDLAPFKKWNTVRTSLYDAPEPAASTPCPEDDLRLSCRLQRWQQFLTSFTPPLGLAELRRINEELNTHRYIIDPINWGVPDYWAIPYQFLLKDGDCEDYAIAKYAALKHLGIPDADMRIVIVQDNNLDAIHAVLAVQFEGHTYIMDNQIEQVLPDTAILHYTPIYSINEHAWWRHQTL